MRRNIGNVKKFTTPPLPRTLEEHESCFAPVFSLELFHSSLSFIKHRRGVTEVVFVAFRPIPVVLNLLTSSSRILLPLSSTLRSPRRLFIVYAVIFF